MAVRKRRKHTLPATARNQNLEQSTPAKSDRLFQEGRGWNGCTACTARPSGTSHQPTTDTHFKKSNSSDCKTKPRHPDRDQRIDDLAAVSAVGRRADQAHLPGPVLFRQIRWGRDQQKIRIYKFRTMYAAECDDSGVRQTTENDPRITAVGAVLRRTNIDELPQLLNVLKGDMSLVGPRCHAIGMLAAGMPYEDLVADYHHRHQVKPGLTGLAQMRGLRGPTGSVAKARARIAADLFYVDNFSFWLDIKIILGTIHSELTCGKGF